MKKHHLAMAKGLCSPEVWQRFPRRRKVPSSLVSYGLWLSLSRMAYCDLCFSNPVPRNPLCLTEHKSRTRQACSKDLTVQILDYSNTWTTREQLSPVCPNC